MHEIIFIIFVLINLPILLFYKVITNKIKLYDYKDGKRKFQKKPVPLIGGFLLIYNILAFTIFDLNTEYHQIIYGYFSNTREYFSFFVGLSLCFLLGVFDDKYNLTSMKKLLSNFIIILIVILADEGLVIRELFFTFLDNSIELRNLSYFFSILCFLLLINALNMFDGINLQTATYCILIFLVFIYKDLYVLFSYIVILTLIFFLSYNLSNKAYLGDNGTQILGFIISYILIKSYNKDSAFDLEEIFILLAIPGLDMFRLFVFRIINGRNPFTHDLNHMHHLISRKYNNKISYLCLQVTIIINLFLYHLIENKIFILIFVIFLYFSLMITFKNYIKK
ncbi:undecaprenyl/decaprenyl-phosphate alpha-N-acetylglucosaminyl 1-phosphate transferase [Candidatus Pelagibacter sp.]|nr:undecaprenyl/decaprenyl-phosphate alpha-N-acetylglucosaminyl 1-phosphate transferase [Candidatus Pelagibacter sp.]